MGVLKIIFSLLILSFPIAEIGRFQLANGIAFSVNDAFLIVLVIFWTGYHLLNKKKINKNSLTKPIFIFIGIALISLILNISHLSVMNFLVAFTYLLRWTMYALIFFIVREFDKKFKTQIPYLLLFSGFITVLIGYAQYFFYPNLGNLFYLGWDEHLYRMFSSFLDPNFAGAFFVIFFMYSIIFVINYFKNKTWIKFLITGLISLLTFGAIYLTYSRSAFIMLIVSTVTFLILKGRKKLILVSVLIMFLFVFLSPRSFKTEGTNLLRTVSSEARITSMKQGLYIFEKSPVFGVGFNAYRYAQNRYLGLDNIYWQTTHSGAGTDNSFIFVLATTGIIGFTAYLYLLYKMLYFSKINLKKNKFAIILFSSLVGLMANSVFINSFFYVLILEWVWILAGLTENS